MTNGYIGVGLTLAGATIAACYRLAQRKLMTRGSSDRDRPSVSALNAGVMIVAAFTLLIGFVLSGEPAAITGQTFWLAVLVSGILNIGISYCGLEALKREDASLVVPIADTTPAIVVFVAWLVTGESPSWLGYVGILFLVLGTYTLNIHTLVEKLYKGEWSLRTFFAPWTALSRSVGVRFAFMGALLGCVAISFDGLAARNGHPLLAVGLIVTFSAVFHSLRTVLTEGTDALLDRRRAMPQAALIGLLFAAAVGLYFFSLNFLYIAYQATLKRSETLILLILAAIFLHERKNLRSRAIAVILLVIGGVLVTWSVK